ncbi:MAG: sigma-70 family RNA polymerase sigma factor [Myxococcota bacterium]
MKKRFDALVRPVLGDLYRFALRLTRDPVRAEDLLQTSLVKGLGRLQDLRDDRAYKAWQSRILYTTWLDAKAKRKEEPMIPERVEARGARGPGPEGRLMGRQLGDAIAQALDRLPVGQRDAVWLVDGQGHSFAETAEILGIAPGTAASRVARARRALREWLAPVALDQGVLR